MPLTRDGEVVADNVWSPDGTPLMNGLAQEGDYSEAAESSAA